MLNPGPQPRPGESEPAFSQAPAGLQDIKCEVYQMDSENRWPSLHLDAQGTNFSFNAQRCRNRAQLTFPLNFHFDCFFSLNGEVCPPSWHAQSLSHGYQILT